MTEKSVHYPILEILDPPLIILTIPTDLFLAKGINSTWQIRNFKFLVIFGI